MLIIRKRWKKVYPEKGEIEAPKAATESIYKLSKLDDQTLLLVIPTMNSIYRKEMNKLVKEHKALIKSTPNLVIDCRNNGGGSDLTYFKLRQFIYTNDKWNLFYATTRNSAVDDGKGIDNIGIPPHIRLDDSTEDWIAFAKDYLKKNRLIP